jgi:hypothetical protein
MIRDILASRLSPAFPPQAAGTSNRSHNIRMLLRYAQTASGATTVNSSTVTRRPRNYQ